MGYCCRRYSPFSLLKHSAASKFRELAIWWMQDADLTNLSGLFRLLSCLNVLYSLATDTSTTLLVAWAFGHKSQWIGHTHTHIVRHFICISTTIITLKVWHGQLASHPYVPIHSPLLSCRWKCFTRWLRSPFYSHYYHSAVIEIPSLHCTSLSRITLDQFSWLLKERIFSKLLIESILPARESNHFDYSLLSRLNDV